MELVHTCLHRPVFPGRSTTPLKNTDWADWFWIDFNPFRIDRRAYFESFGNVFGSLSNHFWDHVWSISDLWNRNLWERSIENWSTHLIVGCRGFHVEFDPCSHACIAHARKTCLALTLSWCLVQHGKLRAWYLHALHVFVYIFWFYFTFFVLVLISFSFSFVIFRFCFLFFVFVFRVRFCV